MSTMTSLVGLARIPRSYIMNNFVIILRQYTITEIATQRYKILIVNVVTLYKLLGVDKLLFEQ